MKKLLIATAALCTALPFTFDGVTPTVSKAQAVIGRPLTPGSIAGVIAARCAAPMASVPISAITPLLVVQLSRRPLPEPVTMAQATAVGAVGAGIVLSSRAQSVWAAPVSVWAAMVSWAATRPITIPAGTHFARILAMLPALLLGPARSTSDWRYRPGDDAECAT